MEQPYCRYAILGPSAGSDTVKTLKMKVNIANVLGYRVNIDEDLSAAINTNPV